jgi:hypothetical protein
MITTEHFTRWVTGTGLVALAGLAWSASPPGYFWSTVLAAGLLGSAVATVLLVRNRSLPSLAQVITTAEAEPAAASVQRAGAGGAVLRPGGEGKP